jgi:16S rRNA (guanine527-N7)-methyltransferase
VTGSGASPEQVPASAAAVFGARLALAERFATALVTDGVVRGVIGPREPARIWSRHLLNCAVVTDLFPESARVVDVGSGAGLPGIAMAIRRPDLRVDLIEPLQRRVDFLTDVIESLDLRDQIRIGRGRAEDRQVNAEFGSADWVTARAVAPLDRLVRWCLPLLAEDGGLALIKGATAAEEIAQHRLALERAGGIGASVTACGTGLIDPPASVVTIRRAARQPARRAKPRAARKGER